MLESKNMRKGKKIKHIQTSMIYLLVNEHVFVEKNVQS